MSSSISCIAPCGDGSQCFPIYSGKRIAGGELPNEYDSGYLLRCTDNQLFRRQRNPNGSSSWSTVTMPQNCPYVFLDTYADVVCLMNFEGRPTQEIPSGPVGPMLSTTFDTGNTQKEQKTTTRESFDYVAKNSSVVHCDQDGSSAGGVVDNHSLLHASAPSSSARGYVNDRSEIRTGGTPRLKNLPRSSRLTLAQFADGKTLSTTFDSDSGNVTTEDGDKSFASSSKVILGSVGAEHASGTGLGSMVSGVSSSQSSLLATADGSLSVGIAEKGEVHQTVGKGSTVLGRANTALGAYSQAVGHNALTYMHSQFAQAIKTANSEGFIQGSDRIQWSSVPLRGHTTCSRKVASDGTVTGFSLTTYLVLGDTIEQPLINQNGVVIDSRRFPFLPFNGTALIEADVVSSRLIPSSGEPIPSFAGKYCFSVTRIGSDNQIRYELENSSSGQLSTVSEFPPKANLGLEITPVVRTGAGAGFTIKIVETIHANVNGVVSPRINSQLIGQGPIDLQGRVWGGHFSMTEVPAGESRVVCMPDATEIVQPVQPVQRVQPSETKNYFENVGFGASIV